MTVGVTLDAGALIAVDRGDRHIGLMLKRNAELGARVTIPATALAQVVRDPRRQARLMRLARHEATDVVPLDMSDAVTIGRLLAASRTADIADGHVAICASRAGQPVITSDPADLGALAPAIKLVPI